MTLAIICTSVLFLFSIIMVIINDNNNNNFLGVAIFLNTILAAMFLNAIFYGIQNKNNPKAIDVYRGNTVLQITYQDSIPIDSVVVYKNK